MKRILTIIVAMAAFLAAENTADAQLLKNLLNKVKGTTTETAATVTETAATTNGKAAGAALRALYTQYKADGKMDMSNLTNLANIATLASNVQDLKGQTDKSSFYKDFLSGLISGSNNLVNSTNSTTVMEGLQTLVEDVDLSGLTQKAEETATTTAANLTEKITNASAKATTAVENASEVATAVTNILNLFK